MFLNRLTVFTKRILKSKLYLAMLCFIILMSVIYALLPVKVKSTDIKVALYIDDTYTSGDLYTELSDSDSIYTYCLTDSLEELRKGVESGDFECGFYIPEGFFNGYINGRTDTPKITRYETSGTTLGNAITESIFSRIFKLCAADILYIAYDAPEYNNELCERLNGYLNGDKIFQIEDCSSNRIIGDNETVSVNIPIRQFSILLIIFSGLLGLLTYVRDSEKNIYIAQRSSNRLLIRLTTLLGSLIPMFVTSLLCCIVTYKNLSCVLALFTAAFSTIIFSVFPGILFKKSSSLSRLLPVIMLVLIPVVILL